MKNQILIALLAAALVMQPGCKISFSAGGSDAELVVAAENGDLKRVQELLDDGININTKAPGRPGSNLNDMSALRQASQNGHTEVVKFLLNKGAQVDITDSLGVTPLIAASEKGHLDIVRLLVEKGANVNTQATGIGKMTALIMAAQNGSTDVVQYLISKGADLNTQGIKGVTAIRLAAQNGHLKTVQVLSDAGADINIVDELGYTPLSIAQQQQHFEVADFLASIGGMAPEYATPEAHGMQE